ncbi:MAG: hypothetical protein HYS43_00030 [Candidatus Liptonbacteria bacterium]|nr:hypothetical protein [Candidatus Liptonbacteria bacterium]
MKQHVTLEAALNGSGRTEFVGCDFSGQIANEGTFERKTFFDCAWRDVYLGSGVRFFGGRIFVGLDALGEHRELFEWMVANPYSYHSDDRDLAHVIRRSPNRASPLSGCVVEDGPLYQCFTRALVFANSIQLIGHNGVPIAIPSLMPVRLILNLLDIRVSNPAQ